MRISDWSSDVCSSDLPGKGRHRFPCGHHRRKAQERCRAELNDCYPSCIDLRRIMADGDNLPRDHQRADDCQPFALSQTAGDTIGSRQREHSRKGKTRSEEHTSELQSLMRISYTVFCLKKKKKNK